MSTEKADPRAIKRRLRAETRRRVLEIPPARRRRLEAELLRAAADLPGLADAQTVLVYAKAFEEEINTQPLVEELRLAGKRVIFPRVDKQRRELELFHVADPESELVPGTKSIPEPGPNLQPVAPDEVDWALVPGLAFDAQRNRLGRGAGHYDRLLPRLRPAVPKWSLAFEEQCYDDIPIEAHDQSITGILTPNRAIIASLGLVREFSPVAR